MVQKMIQSGGLVIIDEYTATVLIGMDVVCNRQHGLGACASRG